MNNLKFSLLILTQLIVSCSNPHINENMEEEVVLSAWNDTPVKAEIVHFVNSVTNESSEDYVPEEDRVAVFDNDGTLWCEKPLYIPVELAFAHIIRVYPSKPEWKEDGFYTAIYNGDLSLLKSYSTTELGMKLFAANDGQKEEDYKAEVYNALSTIQHKRFQRPLKELTYLPMVQLVHYLQKNGFQVYIVTGGEISSVRTVSEEIYNIPKQNVVGSSVKYTYASEGNNSFLVRTSEINSANDKQVKPTNIELHIGRKPIFAAGNSDGDYQMMEYTLSGEGPSMAILVHHNDSVREYDYMHGTEKAVADAESKGWKIVSMKDDFKNTFASN